MRQVIPLNLNLIVGILLKLDVMTMRNLWSMPQKKYGARYSIRRLIRLLRQPKNKWHYKAILHVYPNGMLHAVVFLNCGRKFRWNRKNMKLSTQQKALLSAIVTLVMLWLLFSGRVTVVPVQIGVPVVLILQFIMLQMIYKKKSWQLLLNNLIYSLMVRSKLHLVDILTWLIRRQERLLLK